MNPIVAIFAQGAMGAGLAKVLTSHGVTVLTSLEGRSAASAARARDAGMQAVRFEDLASADLVLAVLPPAEALPFARRFAAAAGAAARKPLYVDCNAISPDSVRRIETVLIEAGCAFADIGIIGLPPREGSPAPRLYAAGPGAGRLDTLRDHGLEVRRLEGPAGTASALKMAYGGITKGVAAVASAMILGASRAHVAGHLAKELADSEGPLLASLTKRIPDMLPKAYRWVAEMREISEFCAADPAAAAIYAGAADFYARIAADVAGPRDSAEQLERFFRA
ncbi:MAG TPA: DUF1932 domain-containing protein [Steroidobacteraceae bacterium]|nr:DUF1932 domain-containing protein [Steroidobacteraceae bacterium]